MRLQDILSNKGSTVYSIRPEQTLGEAVRELVDRHVGALLVYQADDAGKDRLVGIISERDLLFAHAGRKGPAGRSRRGDESCCWLSCTVAELMTTDLITVSPDDSIEQVMDLMTTKRIRHLPVMSGGRVVGVVSIGDVVKAQHDLLAMENRFMKDYIRG
jgi:CBS domain-containing protein